jgi:Cu2+-containing amine oxidase
VKPEELYADGWAIGYDERFPASKRVQQALLFARFSEHDNLYAHPMVRYILTMNVVTHQTDLLCRISSL